MALHPPVRRAIAQVLMVRFVVAAWEMSTPAQLIWHEYARRGSVRSYRLRGDGMRVWLQHGRDLEALYELIHRGEYEPPPAQRERLNRPGLRVVDVGANIGMFSAWVLRSWPNARIVAFEPEPTNVELYRRWTETLTSVNPPELIDGAATTYTGTVSFQGGLGSGSFVDPGGRGPSVPAIDVFPYLADADFVKIDIEGGEWEILTDPRLAELSDLTLVMEYHRHNSPYLPARRAAQDVLEKAGFSTGYGQPNHWGHGTLWAWKD